MGFLENLKINNKATTAYRLHVMGNQQLKKGETATALENHAKALKLYDECYAKGCRKSQYLLSYSILLMRAGELERAKEVQLEINKDKKLTKEQKYELRVDYGICQWRLGNLDVAIETLRRADQSGKSSLAYTTLGMLLVDKARQTGDFTEAMEYNLEAMDYDDEDASTLDNMGHMYLGISEKALADGNEAEAKENRAKAYDYLKKAHARKETQVTTLYTLARLYYEDGDMENARKFILGAEKNHLSAMCAVSKQDIQDLKEKID